MRVNSWRPCPIATLSLRYGFGRGGRSARGPGIGPTLVTIGGGAALGAAVPRVRSQAAPAHAHAIAAAAIGPRRRAFMRRDPRAGRRTPAARGGLRFAAA